MRRIKSEVEKELPPKSELVLKVQLSSWQKMVYNGITEHGRLAFDPQTGKIGNQSLRNAMMQLRKIVNHPYLFLENYADTPYEVVERFVEVHSGKDDDRPLLDAAINLAKRQGAVLVISKLDRLSRRVSFIAALME